MRCLLLPLVACAALTAGTQALGDSGGTTTYPAYNITSYSATLHGQLPDGPQVFGEFTWEGGGQKGTLGAGGNSGDDVSETLTRLTPDTEYIYRLEATIRDSLGHRSHSNGAEVTFRTLPPQADLIAEEDVSNTSPTVGATFTFNALVTNVGSDDAEGVVATITLAAGLSVVSVSADTGTCTTASPVVCTIGHLQANAKALITITASPTAAGMLTSSMQLTETTQDPVPTNNTAGASVTVPTPPPPPIASRKVTLSANGRGGAISSPITACRAGAHVTVSRQRSGKWHAVAHTTAATGGAFKLRARLVGGRYRATVAKSTVGVQRCAAATSRPRTFR